MAYKVLSFSVFLLFLSCNSQDATQNSIDSGIFTTETINPKKYSYEDQLLELYKIFRIAQSTAVPQETLDSVISRITDQRLSLTKEFIIQYTKRIPIFVNDKFLSKPDKETLKAIYYLYMIGVDAFTNAAADPIAVINKGISDVSDRDLLVNYYKVLFIRMHRVQGVQDYSQYSIKFDQLGLESAQEKAILYYISMSYFGAKYNRLIRNGCEKAQAYAHNMPLYEGKGFYAYKLPEYASFDVVYDQLKGRVPFFKIFGDPVNLALTNYKKCN